MFSSLKTIGRKVLSGYAEVIHINKSMLSENKARIVTPYFILDILIPVDKDVNLATDISIMTLGKHVTDIKGYINIESLRVEFDDYIFNLDSPKKMFKGVKFTKADMSTLISFWNEINKK